MFISNKLFWLLQTSYLANNYNDINIKVCNNKESNEPWINLKLFVP